MRTPSERFWRFVVKSDGCWEWTGERNPRRSNHGRFWISTGVRMLAHRFAWQEAYGPIPSGMLVCHKCDNPPCVRPDHLFLGTQSDNFQDASRKGRIGGEMNGMVKLTLEQVREIRVSPLNQSELARKFGVTSGAVWRILRGRTWRNFK